jgi:hypothetical protein
MKIASSLNSCNKSFQVLLILTIFRKLELEFGNFQKLGTVLSFDSVFFQKIRAQCALIPETLNDQNQRLSTKPKKCTTWKTSQFKWVQVQEFGNMKAYREREKTNVTTGLLSIEKANGGHIEFCIFHQLNIVFILVPILKNVHQVLL